MGYAVPTITLTATNVKMPPIRVRPDGVGALTELSPIGYANNWQCVDELISDDDSSYVYSSATSLKKDLYTLPSVSHFGTITGIKIYSIVKSHLTAQETTGVYKIIVSDDGGANIYESDDIDLTTSYSPYSYFYTKNPRTGVDWTWADIDNLQIGNECSSPSTGGYFTLILRPNGPGRYANNPILFGAATHWEACKDIILDNDLSYIENNTSAWQYDCFSLTDHTSEKGTILTVSTHCAIRTVGGIYGNYYQLLSDGVNDITKGIYSRMANGYGIPHVWAWATAPDGGSWTWAKIDTLQAGIIMRKGTGNSLRCSQIYVTVDYYIAQVNSEIRTTQQYVDIYTTQTISCILPKPEWDGIQVNQDIDTNALNFWSGDREVYSLGRSSKRTTLSGIMWNGCTDGTTTCEDIIHCIRALGKLQQPVAIAGLRYSDLNVDYNIISFSWKQQSECTNIYDWNLELEFTD